MLKYLLLLAHVGIFSEVNYIFFVKGHTKNACDRGFRVVKRSVAKKTFYTMQQLFDHVNDAVVNQQCVSLEAEHEPFSNYKDVVDELYKNLKGIQKYHIFTMMHSEPGVVQRRTGQGYEPVPYDLRCVYDSRVVTAERALELLDGVKSLPEPTADAEKIADMHKNVSKYIPTQYRNDSLYAPLTAAQASDAKRKKR